MRQEAEQRADLHVTIDADFDQVWYLVSDVGAWPGLMPHIHAVEMLAWRDDRCLIRVDARHGWLPLRFLCGVERRQQRKEGIGKRDEWRETGVLRRWYVAGPWRGTVETWRVKDTGDGIGVSVSIVAPGRVARLARGLVILPLARRTLAMVELLGEAHRDVHRPMDEIQ